MIIKTFRYKLKLTKSQEETFDRWISVCRTIYNLAKEVSEDNYRKIRKTLSAYDLTTQITDVKKDYDWMRELPKDTLLEPAFRYIRAKQNFFRNKNGFPKWAKKDRYNTLVFTQSGNIIKIDADKIYIHKIGWIRFFNSRSFDGKIKQVLLTKKYNGWFMSIVAEVEQLHLQGIDKEVGIDLGLNHFAITSDGEFINHPKYYNKHQKELRVANRSLARKKKGSYNKGIAKKKLQKIHNKIFNSRNDYLQKLSSRLISESQAIMVEDLQVSNMVRNKHLAKSILDSGWSDFVRMLAYKANWYGRELIKVPPEYTSSDCSICGYRNEKMLLSVREWICPICKTEHDRDVNAAKNIKKRGRAVPLSLNVIC